jgi:hypothetical protein
LAVPCRYEVGTGRRQSPSRVPRSADVRPRPQRPNLRSCCATGPAQRYPGSTALPRPLTRCSAGRPRRPHRASVAKPRPAR